MNVLEELQWRGLIADCTDAEKLAARLAQSPATLYCGFDPTADSLHVGNLVPLLALRRFQQFGHRPIALAGGATGLIGDPSGKTAERQLLTAEILEHNIGRVKSQLQRLLSFLPGSQAARLLDNAAWMAPISFLDFLRDVGKHFTVNVMVAKESVRARMEDRDSGISFTEFSYMLLQAYDFLHLRQAHDCELQIGGSDQWGNITAGIELCRKKIGAQVFGLTLPLLTNADGSKFGKSVAGAIWLDPAKTSSYRFYQFWIQTDDRDAIRFLKYFTFLKPEEIDALAAEHEAKPEGRAAHRALAREMTRLIHGETALADAEKASQVLFGGEVEGLSAELFAELAQEVPSHSPLPQWGGGEIPLIEIILAVGLSPSKGQARKDIEAGGIYLNNRRENDVNRLIRRDEFQHGRFLLLRKGKRNYAMLVAETVP